MHVGRLVSKILPLPYQLDPSFGSYYSNASGLFRGDVRYYNLSSIPYDFNVTWGPIADRVMENANLSAIPEQLGSWNWSAADAIRIKVHDRMTTAANVSENVAIFQVFYPLFYHAYFMPKIFLRANSSCSPQTSRTLYSWSSMECTSRGTALSTRLPKRKGMSRCATLKCFLFDPLSVHRLSTYGISQALFLSAHRTLPRWSYKTR